MIHVKVNSFVMYILVDRNGKSSIDKTWKSCRTTPLLSSPNKRNPTPSPNPAERKSNRYGTSLASY